MRLWLHQVSFFIVQVYSIKCEKNLTQHLLSDYSPYIRPVKNPGDTIGVQVGIELTNIEKLNEKEQYITVKVWLRMTWRDELMTWEPKNWDNIKKLKLDPEYVWFPDMTLYNEIADDLSAGTGKCKTQIVVLSDGVHRWSCPIIYKFSCLMNVEDFPLDKQACYMKFGSWAYDQSKLDLILDDRPILTNNYVNSSEWDLLEVDKKLNAVTYTCCPNAFLDITFKLVMGRKPLFYTLNVISPCIILMALILSSFCLPPNSGERISLIITVMLAFAIFMQMMSNILPKNSNSTPALSIFYITIITETASSFVATCFVLIIYYKGTGKDSKPPPQWVRNHILPKMKHVVEESTTLEVQKDVSSPINYEKVSNNGKDADSTVLVKELGHTGDLLNEAKSINSRLKDQGEQDEIEMDWHLFAKAFDRFFFILFFILYAVSTFTILLPLFLK